MEDLYREIEADMLARATDRVLASGDYVDANGIVELLGIDAGQLQAWERAGSIFSVQSDGKRLYPLFALDPQAAAPRPALASILTILTKKDGWRMAFWFSSLNSWLNDQRPQDALANDPQSVIAAAKEEAAGVQHG